MKWYDIQGWFDFEQLYFGEVQRAQPGAHFVEIGAWQGKSTAFMAQAIKDSKRQIRFDAVDTWEGSPDEKIHADKIYSLQLQGTTLYDRFLHNMRACGVLEYVNPVRQRSTEAAKLYPDKSIDFVFIDGQHTYAAVCADIDAWLPKVKPGGLLAGHDHKFPPVTQAVLQRLGNAARRHGRNSWIYSVPQTV